METKPTVTPQTEIEPECNADNQHLYTCRVRYGGWQVNEKLVVELNDADNIALCKAEILNAVEELIEENVPEEHWKRMTVFLVRGADLNRNGTTPQRRHLHPLDNNRLFGMADVKVEDQLWVVNQDEIQIQAMIAAADLRMDQVSFNNS